MNDPLEVLYVWPYELREQVANILKPLAGIRRQDGSIRWNEAIDHRQDSRELWKLALGASAELGYGDSFYLLSPSEAEKLAQLVDKDKLR